MIYECLQCQSPQSPGDVACPHCGAQFAGPVPEDATLFEEQEAPPPLDISQAAKDSSPEADISQAVVDTGQPEAPLFPPTAPLPGPPMPQTAPAASIPYATAASMPYVATTYAPYAAATEPKRASYPPALIVGTALGILILVGVVYFLMNLGQTAVSSSPPPAAPVIVPSLTPIQPVSTHAMTGGTMGSAPASGTSAEAAPVGRWMTKTFDFYEFDKDGTGSRGSVNDGKPAVPFSWVVVKNQMVLSMPSKSSGLEQVPFSYGPGGDTLYLRQSDGRYLEYSRTGQ